MKSKVILLILLIVLLPVFPAAGIRAQSPLQPKGIWFNNTNTILNRFAYSQVILWPTSLGGHLYLYIRDEELGNLSSIYTANKFRRTFTQPPVWDNDSLSWNYGVHPIMGGTSYLSYRNKRAHWAEAFAGSAVNSIIYEYIIAGATQRPSINDMIVTPVLGSLLGEGVYQLKKKLIRDHHLNFFEKVFITITDPMEVLYYGFNFRKIQGISYR